MADSIDLSRLVADNSGRTQRVTRLCAGLLVHIRKYEGAKLLADTRFDGKLSAEVGTGIARDALELLCKWMIVEATPVQIFLYSGHMFDMIRAVRQDRNDPFIQLARATTIQGAEG